MKKNLIPLAVIAMILANLVMLTSAFPAKAQGQPEIYFDPASYTGTQIGESFNVTVKVRYLEATQEAVGVQFGVHYDPTLLEALNVTEGSFLQQFPNSEAPPYTLFMNFTEDDSIFGPNVLVGIFLLPNSTGSWTNFPFGSGTLATITFGVLYRPIEPSTATSTLTLVNTMIMDENLGEIAHTTSNATYEASPIGTPMLRIEPSTYNASLIGEVFTTDVTINNLDVDSRLIAVQFRVRYDPQVLEAMNVAEGSFLQQFPNSEAPPYTLFMNFTRDDTIFGPNVLVGILLLPNGTGFWTNFPFGSGTLATITFKAIEQTAEPQPPASTALTLIDTQLVNDTIDEIPHNLQNSSYQIKPLSFDYEPTAQPAGQPVLFEAPTGNHAVTYHWSFGDGTSLDTTDPTTGHIYVLPGTYDVTLACSADDLTSSTVSKTITILSTMPTIDVKVDVGSMYFKGETAEFSVLVTNYGESVNATGIKALLYHGNMLLTDLTNATQFVATGLYRIPYTIPANSDTGAYTLIVEVEYYNAKGTDIRTFQISQMMTATITAIQDDIATIQTDVNTIKANLTAIHAKLTDVQGNTAIINTTLGTLQTDLHNINATLSLSINNEGQLVAQINTTLGNVSQKVDTINGNTANLNTNLGNTQTTLYIALILSVIAIVLAAAILIFVRKK